MESQNNAIKNDIPLEKMSSERHEHDEKEGGVSPDENLEYGSLEWWQKTVDIAKLEEIFRSFADLFRVGVSLLTPKGRKVILVNASAFCEHVHSIRKGKAICDACDKRAIRTSLKQGDIHMYTCANGLTDLCAPLYINGRLAGFLASGQVQSKMIGDAELEGVSKRWTFVRNDE